MKNKKTARKIATLQKTKKLSVMDQVKAARRQNREEEIIAHGKTLRTNSVVVSQKQYQRNPKHKKRDIDE